MNEKLKTVEAYNELKKRWLEQDQTRTNRQLAIFLGRYPQHTSQWSTGTDGKYPPVWALVKLATALGLKLEISEDISVIVREP